MEKEYKDIFCEDCRNRKNKLFSRIEGLEGRFTIGTLGPKGTTSYQTCKFLIENLEGIFGKINVEIKLYKTFDLVFNSLLTKQSDFILLPNAYPKITEFYWDSNLELLYTFLASTPEYGIVKQVQSELLNKKYLTIATCKAVEHLLVDLLETTKYKEIHHEVIEAYSTTASLKLLLDDKVDLAITNTTSLNEIGNDNAKLISKTLSAEVLWSIFSLR